MAIEHLSSLELPEWLGIKREPRVPLEERRQDFDQKFDFHTLFYDAIYLSRKRSICLICPKLHNLEALLQEAVFTVAGERLEPRVRHWRRFDQVWLPCPGVPGALRVRIHSFESELAVSLEDRQTFRGQWCAFLKSKDNDLDWIRDWAEFHVKVHRLQGLVLFDNESEQYSVEDVHETLRKVAGLQQVKVLSAPFPYGPLARGAHRHESKFLSAGLSDIARLRYFRSAAAVLAIDVDELVAPIADSSVFAAAENSPNGYVSFRGNWRYPRSVSVQPARHVDHVYRFRWPLPKPPHGAIQATKYCVCPKGPLGSSQWGSHSVLPTSSLTTVVEENPTTDRIEYWHCRRIATDWKYPRKLPKPWQLKLDRRSRRVLHSIFPHHTRSTPK